MRIRICLWGWCNLKNGYEFWIFGLTLPLRSVRPPGNLAWMATSNLPQK